MAIWTLIPDKIDEGDTAKAGPRFGIFGTTLTAFFLLPMRLVHGIAAAIFLALGVMVLLGFGSLLPGEP